MRVIISNLSELRKPLKSWRNPVRFTLTLLGMDANGAEIGGDIIGCVAGVKPDGTAEWRGPAFQIFRRPAYNFIPSVDLYNGVLAALHKAGIFRRGLDAVLEELEQREVKKALPILDAAGEPLRIEVGKEMEK